MIGDSTEGPYGSGAERDPGPMAGPRPAMSSPARCSLLRPDPLARRAVGLPGGDNDCCPPLVPSFDKDLYWEPTVAGCRFLVSWPLKQRARNPRGAGRRALSGAAGRSGVAQLPQGPASGAALVGHIRSHRQGCLRRSSRYSREAARRARHAVPPNSSSSVSTARRDGGDLSRHGQFKVMMFETLGLTP